MCPFATTFALIAIVIGLIYVFLVWHFGYWKKQGIKEAKSYPFVGSFPSIFTQKRNVAYDLDDIYKQYKNDENFVGVYSCRLPQLLILNTEYVHKIFVNDFKHFHDNEMANFIDKKVDPIVGNNAFLLRGEEWKERRAEITPGLTASRIKSVYPVTQEVCQSFCNYIKQQSKMGPKNGLNAKEICLRYTTEVVSDCVLGIKAASFTDTPTPIFQMIKKVFDQSALFFIYMALISLLPAIKKIWAKRFFDKEVEKFFTDLMRTSIELRQKTNADRADFLSYILQLKEKKNLSTMELTSHTMTFLVDGFETTALVLAHTLLLIARNSGAQHKLRQEILSKNDINFEDLQELPYLDACVQETLRIFPPGIEHRKLCTIPYELVNKNGTKVQVKVGDVVHIPAHAIQHDPEIYENPEEFMPERFLETDALKKYRDMGAFLGFGDGPRVCLGMRFATTQMKAAIVEIVRNFNIKPNDITRKDNQLDDTYFMSLLKGGIWLDFEPRT